MERVDYVIEIIGITDESTADKLVKELNECANLGVGEEWEVNYLVDTGEIGIMGSGWEEGSYDPGCYYTKNGDGWPESFDVDDANFCEDDLYEFMAKFQENNNYTLKKIDISTR